MNISPKMIKIDQNYLWVELSDCRTLGVPLVWFPRLMNADPEQLENYELTPRGIHWDVLDEDISIEGLLAGQGDHTNNHNKVA